MQSSKEYQGEIRKPSSVISAKKEENNRKGMTRDLFKKIRDTKGTLLEKEMASHSSVLAWRIPGMGGGLVGCCLWGRIESDMTEVT